MFMYGFMYAMYGEYTLCTVYVRSMYVMYGLFTLCTVYVRYVQSMYGLATGSPVARVNDQKHLGLILHPSLSFVNHINEKKNKKSKEKYRNYQTLK